MWWRSEVEGVLQQTALQNRLFTDDFTPLRPRSGDSKPPWSEIGGLTRGRVASKQLDPDRRHPTDYNYRRAEVIQSVMHFHAMHWQAGAVRAKGTRP